MVVGWATHTAVIRRLGRQFEARERLTFASAVPPGTSIHGNPSVAHIAQMLEPALGLPPSLQMCARKEKGL